MVRPPSGAISTRPCNGLLGAPYTCSGGPSESGGWVHGCWGQHHRRAHPSNTFYPPPPHATQVRGRTWVRPPLLIMAKRDVHRCTLCGSLLPSARSLHTVCTIVTAHAIFCVQPASCPHTSTSAFVWDPTIQCWIGPVPMLNGLRRVALCAGNNVYPYSNQCVDAARFDCTEKVISNPAKGPSLCPTGQQCCQNRAVLAKATTTLPKTTTPKPKTEGESCHRSGDGVCYGNIATQQCVAFNNGIVLYKGDQDDCAAGLLCCYNPTDKSGLRTACAVPKDRCKAMGQNNQCYNPGTRQQLCCTVCGACVLCYAGMHAAHTVFTTHWPYGLAVLFVYLRVCWLTSSILFADLFVCAH